MPAGFAAAIVAIVGVLVVLRVASPALPLAGRAPRSAVADLILAGLGVLGLVAHCGAMFYTSTARSVPGSQAVVDEVNRLGTGSVVLFAIPALLVIAGLRRLPWPVVSLVVLSLAAVGVTMYDGGPTRVHLGAITVAVTVLAATAATLVRGPSRQPSIRPA